MRPVLKRCKRGKERVKANNKREHQTVDKEQAKHARTTYEVNGSLLLSLPMHLILDILVKLPIYAIFNCKCVCQTFKKILSDPYFVEVHLERAPNNDYSLVIQDGDCPSNIFLAPVRDLDKSALYTKTSDRADVEYFSWQKLTSPASMPKTRSWDVVVNFVGSCNGLLCLKYLTRYIIHYCVCNPILGEYTMLPQSKPISYQFAGFGFCPKTKQYKILRFFPHLGYCDILTLGTDEWRRLSDCPRHPFCGVAIDSSFKGNLHWIVSGVRKPICSFNLETEQYLYLSLPSCFNKICFFSGLRNLLIGTLDGLFCVSCMLNSSHFGIFVMEDYGVESSWIKKLSIDVSKCVNMSIVRFLNNGALVFASKAQVIYYHTRKRTTSIVTVEEGRYCAMAHVPSLMPLKDIVGRENVEQVDRKMLHFSPSKKGKRLAK